MKKTKRKPMYIALTALLILFIYAPIPVSTVLAADQTNVLYDSVTEQQGWIKTSDGKWHYYMNGSAATGWQKINGKWYLFNKSGEMMTGWQKSGNTWYYLKSSGAMATGWQKVGSTWYYLKSSGAMATGWQKIGGVWYYLKGSGAMATGWQKIGSTWYYFDRSGAMAADEWRDGYWLESDGSWADGLTGNWQKDSNGWKFVYCWGGHAWNETVKINGITYTFNDLGYCGHYENRTLREAWDEEGYFTIKHYCYHCGQRLEGMSFDERNDHEVIHAKELGCSHTNFLGIDIVWVSETLNKEYSITDINQIHGIQNNDDIKQVEKKYINGVGCWANMYDDSPYMLVINGTSIPAYYFKGYECFCGLLWSQQESIPALDIEGYDEMRKHQDQTCDDYRANGCEGYWCNGFADTNPYLMPEDPSITIIHHEAITEQVWVND